DAAAMHADIVHYGHNDLDGALDRLRALRASATPARRDAIRARELMHMTYAGRHRDVVDALSTNPDLLTQLPSWLRTRLRMAECVSRCATGQPAHAFRDSERLMRSGHLAQLDQWTRQEANGVHYYCALAAAGP